MTGGTGLDTLTERELQVARLVVDRKTNPEIAAELFLSQKTVQTHLRHIFQKMDVPSRVALARAVEGADRAAGLRNQGAGSGGPADVSGGARRETRLPARR
jgi:DNA-binding CsgD family transcriptional regulator